MLVAPGPLFACQGPRRDPERTGRGLHAEVDGYALYSAPKPALRASTDCALV
jgi:hypothetical protein